MSALSVLARLVVLFALVCVVFGQESSNSSSSSSSATVLVPSSSSSSSSAAIVAPDSSSSSSSSSTGSNVLPFSSSVPVSTSSSTGMPANSTDSSSSSSSTGVAPSGPAPVIYSLSGCNSSYSGNSTADQLASCDGSTGNSQITIMGANFTDSATIRFKVQIACSSNMYTPAIVSVTPTMAVSNTPTIDKVDANSPCTLTVVNIDGQQSAQGLQLTFVSWASDMEETWRLFGMSFMTFIIVVVVLGIIILVGSILCTLACCCGVSLAFLNCCRQRTTTVVLSPQSSGYSSME